jgi:starch phosphorylase
MVSLIDESDDKSVRMAHLAIVGSHAVNGVAALHSHLLRTELLPLFNELWPENFQNKTNGVTHRRWVAYANPQLRSLIESAIGDSWIRDFSQIRRLEASAADAQFCDRFQAVKRSRKEKLADLVRRIAGERIPVDAVYDVQIKRIHEYKRQLLHALQIIDEYFKIVEDNVLPPTPVVHIFGGKAAPGYAMAKLIIKLINSVSEVVNADQRSSEHMRVVFLPDYRVSLAEQIIPAADISEQISTAGMEASGTGNMKLAMNGALTLGTLDGANVEILEEVGPENIYIFGLTASQVSEQNRDKSYRPEDFYRNDPRIQRVIESLFSDLFCPSEPGLFRPVADKLLSNGEPYFHLADFGAYIDKKEQMLRDYHDRESWNRRAILNIARSGKFSSDRTIREYANDIWDLKPV